MSYPLAAHGGGMEYKRFYVKAFEREPGKWRAEIRRPDGKPLKVIGRKKLEKIVTRIDAPTEIASMIMAMAVIDHGSFTRARPANEKFWRRRAKLGNVAATVDDVDPAVRRKARRRRARRVERPPRSGRRLGDNKFAAVHIEGA